MFIGAEHRYVYRCRAP